MLYLNQTEEGNIYQQNKKRHSEQVIKCLYSTKATRIG